MYVGKLVCSNTSIDIQISWCFFFKQNLFSFLLSKIWSIWKEEEGCCLFRIQRYIETWTSLNHDDLHLAKMNLTFIILIDPYRRNLSILYERKWFSCESGTSTVVERIEFYIEIFHEPSFCAFFLSWTMSKLKLIHFPSM